MVKKYPNLFTIATTFCDFLLIRASPTQLPLFHYTPIVCSNFTTTASPLHHRGGCSRTFTASSSSSSSNSIVPLHFRSAGTAGPPLLHCHFTVDEIVLVLLLLHLLQTTIMKVPLHTTLHSACTTVAPPLHRHCTL